ncbi:MAG: hypothetical protein U1F22_08455 [Lysobacterales bacterium]
MPLPPIRLLLGLLLWLGVALGAQAQIAISPQLLDLTLDQAATTNAFRLYNYTSEDKRVRVSLVPWDKDAANEVRDLPSGETTLDRWAIVSPLQFDLPAGKSQAVRVAIRPAVALPPGEHRLMIYFNEETPPKPATTQGATLNVRFRLGAAVYVHVGAVERRGELHSVKADGQGMTLDVTNTGNATTRFDGQYVIYPAGRFPGSGKVPRVERAGQPDMVLPPGAAAAGLISNASVLPQNRRSLHQDYAGQHLAPGRYTLALTGRFGDTDITQAVDLVVPAAGK